MESLVCPNCSSVLNTSKASGLPGTSRAKCASCGVSSTLDDWRSGQEIVLQEDSAETYDLSIVADRQRDLIYVIIAQVSWLVATLGLSPFSPQLSVLCSVLGGFFLAIIQAFYICRLSVTVFGPVATVFLGFLSFVPFVNLFVVLGVNSSATSLLKRNGFEVGFFGVKG